jgi:hypothetical protein
MQCASVDTGEASTNGHPSEPPKRSRLRRTLLGATIGALLAMSLVPYVKGHRYAADRGYLPIYEIGARFYRMWEHHKLGNLEEVKVVFYK